MKRKIEAKIKEKQKELKQVKKNFKESKDKYDKKIDEDLKFKNIINPFYIRKYHSSTNTNMMIIEVMLTNQLKQEIKELKALLK